MRSKKTIITALIVSMMVNFLGCVPKVKIKTMAFDVETFRNIVNVNPTTYFFQCQYNNRSIVKDEIILSAYAVNKDLATVFVDTVSPFLLTVQNGREIKYYKEQKFPYYEISHQQLDSILKRHQATKYILFEPRYVMIRGQKYIGYEMILKDSVRLKTNIGLFLKPSPPDKPNLVQDDLQ